METKTIDLQGFSDRQFDLIRYFISDMQESVAKYPLPTREEIRKAWEDFEGLAPWMTEEEAMEFALELVAEVRQQRKVERETRQISLEYLSEDEIAIVHEFSAFIKQTSQMSQEQVFQELLALREEWQKKAPQLRNEGVSRLIGEIANVQ